MNEVRALLLAGGLGTRLQPLTDEWPKCLMPIGERPLLEYWLETLHSAGISKVLINLHYHAETVQNFLERSRFKNWIKYIYEPELLGTAGTLVANRSFFKDCTTLLIHADNWCQCDFKDFLNCHRLIHRNHFPITMMTFSSPKPQSCGIVETNEKGVVVAYHEKESDPPGIEANGAVYLLEPEVLNWLDENPGITDFSKEVLPNFIEKIATWKNKDIHRDIGSLKMLKLAQADPKPELHWTQDDEWQKSFVKHPIFQKLNLTETE